MFLVAINFETGRWGSDQPDMRLCRTTSQWSWDSVAWDSIAPTHRHRCTVETPTHRRHTDDAPPRRRRHTDNTMPRCADTPTTHRRDASTPSAKQDSIEPTHRAGEIHNQLLYSNYTLCSTVYDVYTVLKRSPA